ncbi:ABC transporter ATP-binding protein [Siculibacillus lacustris]|uniref:ABC transporter ATP-binding protein n=1 Tax=Siculibacillus lacustris TaxID=1549641 RepID=A0A4Q9VNV4_9HYPH|nr:ABC transporter ATP-binding protein [Siculibacillus lacustris]TBW37365.1 ABC transporter ATP-binding protein [Siculibacillus lacustris]
MPTSAAPAEPAAADGPRAAALRLDGVVVEHRRGREPPFRALDIESLEVPPGARVGFAGPSGAGKSTLLHVVAGLAVPSTGRVAWGDTRLDTLGEAAHGRWRRATIGFVFQDFHLVDELTVRDNVLMPARFGRIADRQALHARADALIARMGLDDPRRRAAKLSRGERQRVAVARALLLGPRLILADEPTASLDAEAGRAVAGLLVDAAREHGATLLVVAHDPALLERLDTVHRLAGGRLIAEERR